MRRNPALVRALAAEPDAAPAETTIGDVARAAAGAALARSAHWALVPPDAWRAGALAPRSLHGPFAAVHTAAAEYRLRATHVGDLVFGAGAVVAVLVERAPRPDPRLERAQRGAALRRRYGLTPREVETALLLAEGRTNAQIAAARAVTAHTARRHTEHVLRKCRVHARAAAATRVAQLPAAAE